MRFYQEIIRDGITLRGFIHRPDVCNIKIPMVILLHGFRGNKLAKHQMFVEMAQALVEKGVAVARFDFMGSGDSDGEFVQASLQTECQDAEAILDFVKTLDFVDPQRIGLLGSSLGGIIATMTAARRSREIQALCLNAPAFSIPYEAAIKRQICGMDIETADRLGYIDIGGDKMGLAMVQEIRKLDMESYISAYSGKTLIIHGTADQHVSYRFSEYYVNRFQNAELQLMAGADHLWMALPLREDLYRRVAEFFTAALV